MARFKLIVFVTEDSEQDLRDEINNLYPDSEVESIEAVNDDLHPDDPPGS